MLPAVFTQASEKILSRVGLGFSDDDKAIQHICYALTRREKLARALSEKIGDTTICGAAAFLTFPNPSRLYVDPTTEALYNISQYKSADGCLSILSANRDRIGGLSHGLVAEQYVLRDIYIKFKDQLVFGMTNRVNLCSNYPVGFIKPRKEWISFLIAESRRACRKSGGYATGIETDPSKTKTLPYALFQLTMPTWDKKNVVYDDSLAQKAWHFYSPSDSPDPRGGAQIETVADYIPTGKRAQTNPSDPQTILLSPPSNTPKSLRRDLGDLSKR